MDWIPFIVILPFALMLFAGWLISRQQENDNPMGDEAAHPSRFTNKQESQP